MAVEAFYNKQTGYGKPDGKKYFKEIRGIQRAVHTLFRTPPHDTLHRDVANRLLLETQPTQPPLTQTQYNIAEVVKNSADTEKITKLPVRKLKALGGILMQFTDYVPELQPYALTPHQHVEDLYENITDLAHKKGKPLAFADQLETALNQTDGDLPEALWRLFMTSRLYARWLDCDSITDIPPYTRDEKVNRMITWQRSLSACKKDTPQDGSGDTYYAWTHAYALVAYKLFPEHPNLRTRTAQKTFEKGTILMHTLVHNINPQTVVNDHRIAGEYGNAIGEVCSSALAGK